MFRTLRFYHSFFKFLSTPSARRATSRPFPSPRSSTDFYPRPPRGGRRFSCQPKGAKPDISIHALREEGDSPAFNGSNDHIRFLSTPSARRATSLNGLGRSPENNFYPRPPRGGRLAGRANGWDTTLDFYPRPPRGGRRRVLQYRASLEDISIHALREEGDEDRLDYYVPQFAFLSTPSARRATQTQRINEP